MSKPNDLSVGEFARRAGVPVSTLHFYEAEGLIRSWRTDANHRRYDRQELRRVAVIRVAQSVGVPLAEIKAVLMTLPHDRKLTAQDWSRAAEPWQAMLEERIILLTRLRDQMGFCIGCGCLSIDTCPLYNADDRLGTNGPGARRWTGAKGERADPPGA
jgi:MerR family redox-sensitive transcriptional activator SoxR